MLQDFSLFLFVGIVLTGAMKRNGEAWSELQEPRRNGVCGGKEVRKSNMLGDLVIGYAWPTQAVEQEEAGASRRQSDALRQSDFVAAGSGLIILPRDVVHVIRDMCARTTEKQVLMCMRLVSKDWKFAVSTFSDAFIWCRRLTKTRLLGCTTCVIRWPRADAGSQHPFNLPPFLFEVLLVNTSELLWLVAGNSKELKELARRMLVRKNPALEEMERKAWFKLCGHGNLKAEIPVVKSIFRGPGGYADLLCAGVQTLLLSPAFRDATLALLKMAQRSWFPAHLSSVEIAVQLLGFGVWCECENDLDIPGEFELMQRRRIETSLPRWDMNTMEEAWAYFISAKLDCIEHIRNNIVCVQDPVLHEHLVRERGISFC